MSGRGAEKMRDEAREGEVYGRAAEPTYVHVTTGLACVRQSRVTSPLINIYSYFADLRGLMRKK